MNLKSSRTVVARNGITAFEAFEFSEETYIRQGRGGSTLRGDSAPQTFSESVFTRFVLRFTLCLTMLLSYIVLRLRWAFRCRIFPTGNASGTRWETSEGYERRNLSCCKKHVNKRSTPVSVPGCKQSRHRASVAADVRPTLSRQHELS